MKRFFFAMMLLVAITPSAAAESIGAESFTGCLVCDYGVQITGMANDRCREVSPNSWGDGIRCVETTIMDARFCEVSGGACYYVVTGSGSDPGNGNGTGPYDPSGYCSPEYQSCY